jgi:hypothetical protein
MVPTFLDSVIYEPLSPDGLMYLSDPYEGYAHTLLIYKKDDEIVQDI